MRIPAYCAWAVALVVTAGGAAAGGAQAVEQHNGIEVALGTALAEDYTGSVAPGPTMVLAAALPPRLELRVNKDDDDSDEKSASSKKEAATDKKTATSSKTSASTEAKTTTTAKTTSTSSSTTSSSSPTSASSSTSSLSTSLSSTSSPSPTTESTQSSTPASTAASSSQPTVSGTSSAVTATAAATTATTATTSSSAASSTTVASTSTAAAASKSKSKSVSTGGIVGIVIGCVAAISIFAATAVRTARHARASRQERHGALGDDTFAFEASMPPLAGAGAGATGVRTSIISTFSAGGSGAAGAMPGTQAGSRMSSYSVRPVQMSEIRRASASLSGWQYPGGQAGSQLSLSVPGSPAPAQTGPQLPGQVYGHRNGSTTSVQTAQTVRSVWSNNSDDGELLAAARPISTAARPLSTGLPPSSLRISRLATPSPPPPDNVPRSTPANRHSSGGDGANSGQDEKI